MNGYFPTSSSQRMFWLLEQIEPDMPAYNLPWALLITGRLDIDALRESFRRIMSRHEVLRTRILELEGEIIQEVHQDLTLDLPVRELGHLPVAERMSEALRIAAEAGRQPFDLCRPPLLRLLLLRLGPEKHLLLLVIHHIVTDAWSMSLIFDELAEFYQSLTTGEVANVPFLPVQYADFARWQQEHLGDESLGADFAYWEAQLRGCPELLEIPVDHCRPAVQSHRGSQHSFIVDADTTARLKAMCARERTTLYMGLLAAIQILLSRYSDSSDIPVGTPVAGRNHPDLAHLIGCFVNTVVMRTDLSGEPSFSEVLKRVREVALGAFAHQDLPIAELLARLRPVRTRSHAPFFQVMFIMQNAPNQAARMAGLDIEEVEFDSGMAKFDLTLEVVEQEQALDLTFEYSTDLFEAATIQRMARHFSTLLTAALDAPSVAISRLPILDDTERTQLLLDWNRTEAEYNRQLRIDTAFATQVGRDPNGVALIEDGRSISYAELDGRANQIAHALSEQGMPADAVVGVHLPRSADAYAAILGILKTGHPYVPLDVGQPSARLHRLITDCGCQHIVTRRPLRNALPATLEAILLDTDLEIRPRRQGAPLRSRLGSELAYIIYTSGSTGTPKGVMGTHRGAINRFEWMYRTHPFASGEVCCQKTALGFVDSIWEMFGPLLGGVPVVIVGEDDVLDPERLLTLLAAQNVTRIVLVPTLLQILLDHAPDLGARVPRLRHWTTSGEYLSADLARRFRTACPGAVLLNLYGSSEVAADVTWHEVHELCGNDPVPIGRPISNSQIYILDGHMEPVPIGVTGQIYVAGDCVSAGYWRKPDLTAQRFLPNPFRRDLSGDAHLFATGDHGRFLADGNIEYLGRRDSQVKIRGYRVELNEVEAHLSAHPAVRQAVVLATEDPWPNARQLIAYIVGRDVTMPPPEELRAFLRIRLPQYMVPAIFIEMAELPQLPSGKINRMALPKPQPAKADAVDCHMRARDETEALLASFWRELLHLEDVGVTQDFFDLGGHSLLAMQVLARIRKQFEVDIPIRTLFEAPTIERLAREIEKAKVNGTAPRLRTIRPRPRLEPDLDMLATELSKLSPEQIERILHQFRSS